MRLDLALIARHPGLSRRRAQAAIERGQVSVDGVLVREPGHPVGDAAAVVWDPNRPARRLVRAAVPILFEDEHLVVVDKPAGLLTVPSHAAAGDREDTVLRRLKEWAGVRHPRRPFVGLVHRLDRDTSGALAFALTPAARRALISLVSAHRVERRYAAIVRGAPRDERGVIDLPLAAGWTSGRRRVARGEDEEKERAVTRFTVVERLPGATLLDVTLETGRQHQIRVHLASVGLPVLGDPIYAGARPGAMVAPSAPHPTLPRVGRHMLHAALLAFVHPLTQARLRVESPWPEDFSRTVAALRRGRS